jgi:hypothetical protein
MAILIGNRQGLKSCLILIYQTGWVPATHDRQMKFIFSTHSSHLSVRWSSFKGIQQSGEQDGFTKKGFW